MSMVAKFLLDQDEMRIFFLRTLQTSFLQSLVPIDPISLKKMVMYIVLYTSLSVIYEMAQGGDGVEGV